MSDRDALLRAICENPDDDAPRLIYADWLDEHGDPLQAEFIRVQVELARVHEGDRAAHPLSSRLRRCSDFRKWRYLVRPWPKLSLKWFVRGFSTCWGGNPSEFLESAPAYWRLGPVNEVQFWIEKRSEATTAVLDKVAEGIDLLGNIREVWLVGSCLTDEWIQELTFLKTSERWVYMRIDGRKLTDKACVALAEFARANRRCTLDFTPPRGVTLASIEKLRAAFGERFQATGLSS
jgi:uncharacterized protein (TIGR02996 family)